MRLLRNRSEGRFLIVGLGNPGKKYQMTRHNIGFLAIDFLSKKHGIKISRSRFSSLVGEGRIGLSSVVCIKPMTYMNLSGQAVAACCRYYSISPERIIVICDDVALTPGTLRIRAQGSSGGQKGLLSIEDMLGTNSFVRIRIGVGQPKEGDLADYVLSIPTSREAEMIKNRMDDLTKAVEMILEGNLEGAQSRYNGIG